MSIDSWVIVGSIAAVLCATGVVLGFATKVISWSRETIEPQRVAKWWVSKTAETYIRISDKAPIICKRLGKRHTKTKQRLALRWAIWRKRVRANIASVIAQDKNLQEESATKNERIGMAAIMLSGALTNDGLIHNATCQQVFSSIRQTDPKLFNLLCARIANDIVTNPNDQDDETGANYTLPWDSVLGKFLKAALDEPPTGTPQGA